MTGVHFDAQWRVGHLYPSGGLSEYELQTMAPKGLQFLVTRMPFRNTSREADIAIVAEIETQARLLSDAGVDLIAFNCTAASLIVGPDAINARIRNATGISSITTIEAVLAALAHFGPKKIGLFTPYRAEVVEEEIHYLAANGYQVVAQGHIPCQTPVEQGRLDPQKWIELLADTDLRDAEAILFSCAGICLSPVIASIEARTGLPVVTSNAALLWKILQLLDINERPTGFGRLLADQPSPSSAA